MKAKYSVSNNNLVVDEISQNGKPTESTENYKEISKFRTILPQILATAAKNLLLIDLGLAIAFPTIVIPALTGQQKEKYADEYLKLTADQATWYASIGYIFKPMGSLMSGWLSEPIGRKRAMMFVNIPHIIAWTLLHYTSSVEQVYIAAALLGFGIGFMEGPIATYVGEISQASIRGILTSSAGIAATLGIFIGYLLGSIMLWRNVAIACLSLPLVTIVAIYFVPETPMWLLSKNRPADALKALQWLRGWVPRENVEKEFAELQRYSVQSNSCIPCQKSKLICDHPAPTLTEKVTELNRKRNLKPVALVLLCFAFVQFIGLAPMRSYMVQIFTTYGFPIDPNWATTVVALMSLLANIVCTAIVRVIGKRKLWLISMTGTSLSCLLLGIYAYNFIPSEWSSFDKHEPITIAGKLNYVAMVLFFSLAFFTSIGVGPVPWMLLSEMFPFKSRGFATGMTAAVNYLFTFVSVKTYINFETWFSMSGIMWYYVIVGICGLFIIYNILPETENRSLEDIELYFTDNKRKWTDRKIVKQGKVNRNVESNTVDKENHLQKGCDNKAFVQISL